MKNRIKPTNFEKVVYFSTCANRAFRQNQGYDDQRSLQQVVESLCNKAQIDIIYPEHIENLCCGLSFENYDDVHERAVKDLHDALMKASQMVNIQSLSTIVHALTMRSNICQI